MYVIQNWYSELNDPGHDFNNPEAGGTGHFTQLVWIGSTEVGVGISSSGEYIICNYLPAGNWAGQYTENVLPLQ